MMLKTYCAGAKAVLRIFSMVSVRMKRLLDNSISSHACEGRGFFIAGDAKTFLLVHQAADQELQAEHRLSGTGLADYQISFSAAQTAFDPCI